MADSIDIAIYQATERVKRAIPKLSALVDSLRQPTLDTQATDYLSTTADMIAALMVRLRATNGVFTVQADITLLALTRGMLEAGRNAYRMLASDNTIDAIEKARLMRMSALLSTGYCLLTGLVVESTVIQQTDALLGSANCASTLGGGDNTPIGIDTLFHQTDSLAQASASAITALSVWRADLQSLPDTLIDVAYNSLQTLGRNVVVL